MVEALTIVLAVVYTAGWRAAFNGTMAALVALGAMVALGIPLLRVVPEAWVQIIIGAFLIWFGWGWLKKAVLRASGRKEQRDEAAVYSREIARLQADRRAGLATAFNGVFLEGLEVALIVLAVGGASRASLEWALVGATVALIVVVVAGFVIHAPLSRVPENVMKYAVGVMLTSLGAFWLGTGLGIRWPGDDLAIGWLAAGVLALSLVAVRSLQPSKAPAG
jgi:uncharacterized membrane protein